MESRELILEEENNERLDAIFYLLKAIEEDLEHYSIEEILKANLELE